MSMVPSDEVWCVHVCQAYPFVVAIQETLPLDQVLELLGPSDPLVAKNPFYLLLLLSVHDIGRWPGVVWPMCQGFVVQR